MFLDRSNHQISHNARRVAMPLHDVETLPKPKLGIADGLVSATQQYWVASRHCARGFAGDAA